jgi:cell division protein ZapA (FtsZ GTPase activity inhibitor)
MKTANQPAYEVDVQILDEEYRIASDLGAEITKEVVDCVDAKMREITARLPRLPRVKVAVLAAEVVQVRKEREELLQQAYENISKLNELVEQRSTLLPLTSNWMNNRDPRHSF